MIFEMCFDSSLKTNGNCVSPNTNLVNLFIFTQFNHIFLPNENAKHSSQTPLFLSVRRPFFFYLGFSFTNIHEP